MGLDEIYCGPMDGITVGIELFYGEHKGEIVYETVKAGALAVNYNTPVVSGNPTVGRLHALLKLVRPMVDKITLKQAK